MKTFDQLAGLTESADDLTPSPLKTLGEAGGDTKSTPDATIDYSDGPPPVFMHGDPNTRYRKLTVPKFGSNATMAGKYKARALRTSKPAQFNTK